MPGNNVNVQVNNGYNPNVFTLAKFKETFTPTRLSMIDFVQGYIVPPLLIYNGTWATQIAANLAEALKTAGGNPDAIVDPKVIKDIHTALVYAQFIYVGMTLTRIASIYNDDSKKMEQFLLDNGVFTADELKTFNRSPRLIVRKLLQAIELAAVVTSGIYLATPQNSLYAGFGLIAASLIPGNLADYILKQAQMKFTQRVLGDEFKELEAGYKELAKGFGWKFFGIFASPAVILLLINYLSPLAKQQAADGELSLGTTFMTAGIFSLLSTAVSFPGVMSRMLGAKYEAQMIENVDQFRGTRLDVVTRPTFEFGRAETSAGVMDGLRYKLALLFIAFTAAIVSSFELDSPYAMLTLSLLAGEMYLLMQWQSSQDADRVERLRHNVVDNPLPNVGPGFFTQCGSAITRCFDRAEGAGRKKAAGEKLPLLGDSVQPVVVHDEERGMDYK